MFSTARNTALAAILGALGAVASGPVANATLIGTSVSGQMLVFDTAPNDFDPVNGHVPSGYGNSSPHGPLNVTIGSGTEFGYQDPADTITVDFTATGVTLRDDSGGNFNPVTYVFTDSAFLGATTAVISDNFVPAVTASLVGDVLTLSAPILPDPGTFTAAFSITTATSAPEPQSLTLLAGFVGGLMAIRRRRRK